MSIDFTDDADIVARTLFGEAKANNIKDATAIACVIKNRSIHKQWPNTLAGVCLQKKQFSCWNEGDHNRDRIMHVQLSGSKWFTKCHEIARDLNSGSIADTTNGATHYHTRAVAPKWSKGKEPCYETAGHLFFNDIDTPKPVKKAAQAVAAGGAGLGVIAEVVNQAAPAIPLLSKFIEYAPIAFSVLAFVGVAYLLFERFKKK